MNLALDIGNTRVKIGLFDKNIFKEQAIWTDWTLEQLTDYALLAGVQKIIVSSVAEPDEMLFDGLRENFFVLELSHQTNLPFKNNYTTPQTLGKDRLAAVAGAQTLYSGENCLVVDCGTCIKYDLITASGVYNGGNISPGLVMRLKAMHHFTARLPLVSTAIPEDFIGNSTETALQNGGLRGACLEIEGFAHLFRAKYGSIKLLLSGGDADFLAPFLSQELALLINKNLTLYGLNNILIFNT